ncbi:unnamed protein product [marine sediment metagenome]|uniref:CRISPR type III-associated protein domain-containing protein n=1 Tax=marine sediment metagenome TaxID=412755 RepID=X1IEK5_9ZZZZ
MTKLEVKILFSLESPFHISADRLAFGIDNAICLDVISRFKEKPIIPATSFKGILRHNIETVLNSKEKFGCISPKPEEMCNECIICKNFGSPKNKALLMFEDISIEDGEINKRIGTAIERRRKITKEKQLFTYQTGFGKVSIAKIKGIFENENDALTACALLYIGIKVGFSLGHGKSRGLGWIKLKTFEAKIDNIKKNLEQIKDKIKEILK